MAQRTTETVREIYLDNAATTIPYSFVNSSVTKAIKCYANPSSIHSSGKKVKKLIDASRKSIAQLIGADAEEIIFTSGGSESNNMILRGIVPYLKEIGKTTIVTSAIEHKSVLNVCKELEKDGIKVIYMPVDWDCRVDIEEFDRIMREHDGEIGLVYIMSVNNEVGSIQLIDDIGDICAEHGVLFGTDAVQAIGTIPIDVKKSNISLMAMSGHKIHALKGCGAAYIKKGVNISPLILGGSQEHGMRAGTENVAGIISFGKAANFIQECKPEIFDSCSLIRERFLNKLDSYEVEYKVNCDGGVPNILSLAFPGCESEALLLLLNSRVFMFLLVLLAQPDSWVFLMFWRL